MRSREAQPPLRSAGGRPRYVRRRAAGYRSDYDILVIASSKKLAEPQYWGKATDRLLWDKGVSTPVGLIVHGAREVNNFVADGQEFFVDVLHEGVVLYEIDDGARYAAVKVVGANAKNRRFFQRRRARSHGRSPNASMRMCIDEARYKRCRRLHRWFHAPQSQRLRQSPQRQLRRSARAGHKPQSACDILPPPVMRLASRTTRSMTIIPFAMVRCWPLVALRPIQPAMRLLLAGTIQHLAGRSHRSDQISAIGHA